MTTTWKPTRMFSLMEANALLPTLREIFERARKVRERLQMVAAVLREKNALPENEGEIDASAPPDVQQMQTELRDRLLELRGLVEEVQELGAEVKAADGLVDFRTRRRGRVVYLCWKFGEDRVSHWHELDAGFAGRQAIGDVDEFTGGMLH